MDRYNHNIIEMTRGSPNSKVEECNGIETSLATGVTVSAHPFGVFFVYVYITVLWHNSTSQLIFLTK